MSTAPGISFATARRNDSDGLRNLLAPIPRKIARQILTALTMEPGCVALTAHDVVSETAVFLTASTAIVQIWSFRPLSSREFTSIGVLIEDAKGLDPTVARLVYRAATGRDAAYRH